MIDPGSYSTQQQHHYHQDLRSASSASPLPPPTLHSNRTSIDSISSIVTNNNNNNVHHQSHPPPVKARSPLSNLGDHIVKAARRLSMTSSSKDNKDSGGYSYNPPPSPSLLVRSGTTSPDLHRKRNSTLEELQQATSPSKNNSKNKESKVKDKKPLVKMDLFNLRPKSSNNSNNSNNNNTSNNSNSSQVNLAMDALEKSPPGSPLPPRPPSKETFWKSKGMFGRQAVCTEEECFLPQQSSVVPAPSSSSSPIPIPAPFPAPTSRLVLQPAVSQEQHNQEQQQKQGRHQGEDGHTDTDSPMHDGEHAHTVNHHPAKSMQFIDSASPLPAPSPSPVSLPSAQPRSTANNSKPHGLSPSAPPLLAPLLQQQKQSTGFTSTMSTDLSQLSINSSSPQDSSSSISDSDHSLVMEDVFEFYDDNVSVDFSCDSISRAPSMQNDPAGSTTTTAVSTHQRREPSEDWTIDRYHRQQQCQQLSTETPEQHQRPPAPEPTDKKPLNALERIKMQQKRQSQEQERLAEMVLPPELMAKPSNMGDTGYAVSGKDHILPVREIPRDLIPIQSFHPLATASQKSPLPLFQEQQQQQARGSGKDGGELAPLDPGAAIIGTDSVMLDQLLTLIPGPNRPRLPSQIEWQQGIEELRQRRKDAAALTNSVGRQNSSSSRHSQDSSSDGKSRRHSMPDMPHGQSREDQERQHGDNFRNPMLLSGNSGPTSSFSVLNSNVQKRRSGFEDREQQLLQPPIQRQSIAETQAMDASMISSTALVDTKKVARKRAGKRTSVLDELPAQGPPIATSSNTTPDRADRDVVDIAFSEMLATLSLPPATTTQLESLPKDRKWAMLQSNGTSSSLLHTPQTMPPQFFVDLLLEYSGKKKRSSRDQFAFNVAAMTATTPTVDSTPNRPLGMWKNFSATNITSNSNHGFAPNEAIQSGSTPLLQPSFQQHLSSLLGKNDKRVLEEREQVLKKLRVLIRNGSIRWTSEFIKVGGPLALLQFCQHVQRSEETKLGQRGRLLHQVVQCIKAIVTLEGGVESLTCESIFFSLMRTMAIHEAPVLSTAGKDIVQGSKIRTGGLFGISGGGASGAGGQRYRSSSIPKPFPQPRLGHPTHFQSSPALSLDQIPTFSNTQAAVHILIAILAREPELRDKVLNDTVADRNSNHTQTEPGEGAMWLYSEWIGYLKELMHVCGIEAPVPTLPTTLSSLSRENDGYNQDRGRKSSSPPRVTSLGAGIVSQGCGPSGPSLSIFSLENMRNRRRHSAAAAPLASQSTPNVTTGGIRFESGEDQEVLMYLTAHLELVSRLIFEMHLSSVGLAFAKSIKQEHLDDYLERLRSTFIRNHELSAQVEDLLIQLSVIPSTTQMIAARLEKDLPTIPAIDTQSYSHSCNQQEHQQRQQFPAARPTSPIVQRPQSPRMHQFSQQSPVFQHRPVQDAEHRSEIDPRALAIEIPARTSSLDTMTGASTYYSVKDNNHQPYNNNINKDGIITTSGGTTKDRRTTNNGVTKIDSKVQQRVSQFQQQQQQQPQRHHVHGRNGKATLVVQDGEISPVMVEPPSRRISFKKDITDGDRRNNTRSYNPLPPLQPQQQYQRQNPTGRVSSQIAFREYTPSDISIARRSTTGSTPSTSTPPKPLGPTPDSQLPIIPSKSKNRPSSMDAKGNRLGAAGTRVEKVIIKLDGSRQQQQQQELKSRLLHQSPQSPSPATPFPLPFAGLVPRQNPSAIKGDTREDVRVSIDGTDLHKVASNTFGYGRRQSLNSQVYTQSNGTENSSGTAVVATTITSKSPMLAAPTSRAGSALPNGGQVNSGSTAHGVNSVSVNGSVMSTCSSTTSSGFSATSASSASSVSPPSTQTKKQSLLLTTKSFPPPPPQTQSLQPLSKLPRTVSASLSPTFTTTPLPPTTTSVTLSMTPPSEVSPTLLPSNRESQHRSEVASTVTMKGVHQFRNVDFDNRIQADVRKLASFSSIPPVTIVHNGPSDYNNNGSSNSTNNGGDSRSKIDSDSAEAAASTVEPAGRYSVQATDPKVLEAPIIVPEDMSLMREQYIQAQISGLVLPPMARKT